MIDLSDLQIFVSTTPTNMSYSFDSLMGRAQAIFEQNPTSGHLFLFFNRRRDKLKILYWDGDGLAIWYKRLEVGTFQVLATTNGEDGTEIEYWQLIKLLDGLDFETGRRRKRFRLVS